MEYIASKVWQDADGRNRAGMVAIQEQQIFASREVQKGEARPGGYVATGGHGGLLGAVRHGMPPILTYLPGAKHTYLSDVNRTRLPDSVTGYLKSGDGMAPIEVGVKDSDGRLLETAIPKVNILKEGNYTPESVDAGPEREVDILALMNDNFTHSPLAGFVIEGQAPYGTMTNSVRNALAVKASYCGMPVVRVGRGNNEGFAAQAGVHIGGGNLTSTKARLLLLACLMKFGGLPPATDPDNPTAAETAAILERVALYQAVFDTH